MIKSKFEEYAIEDSKKVFVVDIECPSDIKNCLRHNMRDCYETKYNYRGKLQLFTEVLNEKAKKDNISCTLMAKIKGVDEKFYESVIPGPLPKIKYTGCPNIIFQMYLHYCR